MRQIVKIETVLNIFNVISAWYGRQTQIEIFHLRLNFYPHFTPFKEVLVIQRINSMDYNLIEHHKTLWNCNYLVVSFVTIRSLMEVDFDQHWQIAESPTIHGEDFEFKRHIGRNLFLMRTNVHLIWSTLKAHKTKFIYG